MKSFAIALAMIVAASAVEQQVGKANPIRKVTNMLEKLQAKVKAEGEEEETLYKKFSCYCQNSDATLQAGITENSDAVASLGPAIEEAKQKSQQLKADVKQAEADRAEAQQAIKTANAIRAKEASAFAELEATMSSDMKAMGQAITALEKGAGGAFLQTTAAFALKRVVNSKDDLVDDDREQVLAFLSGGSNYAPQSGQITGIIKQMRDEMDHELVEAEKTEKARIAAHQDLMAAQNKQIAASSQAIETKSKRAGELAVEAAQMEGDLGAAARAVEEDKKFLADLAGNCDTKKAEHEKNVEYRSQEMLALAKTIEILTSDDALETFKGASAMNPGESFIQVQVSTASMKARALTAVHLAQHQDAKANPKLGLIALMLRSKKMSFDKVLTMIDDMIALLKKEQVDDDSKKENCLSEIDAHEDKAKSLERDLKDANVGIEDAKEGIKAAVDKIAAQNAAIEASDKAAGEATENRNEEHASYKQLIADNTAAKKLLNLAKNRMNEFYNPALAAKLMQVRAHLRGGVAPPPPPETAAAYSKSSEESNGILAMMDLLMADIDKEMTQAETTEKNDQAEYETTMADLAEQRAAASQEIVSQTEAKANMEEDLQALQDGAKSTTRDLQATNQYLADMHADCDWLLQHHETRATARADEINSLSNAKAVLSGADYDGGAASFLQLSGAKKDAPSDDLAKEMTHDLETNFNKIAPFGKEDTAKELQDHASKTQDTLVDAVENAEVAEIKRAVFRALTRLRAATIKEFDTIARLETQAIDAYNDAHHYRAENPLAHLHEDEAPVETDKLKSFH